MGLEQDKIKDLFASKLGESFEPEVPASIWGGLDQILSQQAAAPTDPASSSTSSSSSSTSATAGKASLLKTVAVAAGVAIAAVTGFVLVQKDNPSVQLPAVHESDATVSEQDIAQPDTTFVVEEESPRLASAKKDAIPVQDVEPQLEMPVTSEPIEEEVKEIEPNPLEKSDDLFVEEEAVIASKAVVTLQNLNNI